jgi:hypothetical protein
VNPVVLGTVRAKQMQRKASCGARSTMGEVMGPADARRRRVRRARASSRRR